MITKDTPTEEIKQELDIIIKEFNITNYNSNPEKYNYLEIRKRNLEDILLTRK